MSYPGLLIFARFQVIPPFLVLSNCIATKTCQVIAQFMLDKPLMGSCIRPYALSPCVFYKASLFPCGTGGVFPEETESTYRKQNFMVINMVMMLKGNHCMKMLRVNERLKFEKSLGPLILILQ